MNAGWRLRGACGDPAADRSLFFGPDGETALQRHVREAKASVICAQCPVRRECLSYAVIEGVSHGYWGAGEDERARIRRNYLRDMGECAA